MIKRLVGIVTLVLLAIATFAEAQQPKKIPRIGFVTGSGEPNNPEPNVEAFRQGLQSLGYIEGKNIFVEYRYPEGKVDRIPSLVAELVQLKVDVFVSPSLSAILAAKQATKTIPIVMLINGNPVELGIIDSLARPGGNITGITRFNRELSGKTTGIVQGGGARDIARRCSHRGGRNNRFGRCSGSVRGCGSWFEDTAYRAKSKRSEPRSGGRVSGGGQGARERPPYGKVSDFFPVAE